MESKTSTTHSLTLPPSLPPSFSPGPVNKTLNMLCVFAEGGKESEAFKRHVGRLDDYLWLAEDGMKMQVRGGREGGREGWGKRNDNDDEYTSHPSLPPSFLPSKLRREPVLEQPLPKPEK